MKIYTTIIVCLLANLAIAQTESAKSLISYVHPIIGTANSKTISALKHGGGNESANTIPAVGVPFGMTQWTPQTNTTEQKCRPPYAYRENIIYGFRGTHWLSGSCTQDYGSVTIMPVTGELKTKAQDFAALFSHQDETSGPDYYKVSLSKYKVTTEITATLRCGMMQFTTGKDDSLYLLVMPNSDYGQGFVKIDKINNEVVGFNPVHRVYQGFGKPAGFNGYFVMQIQKIISTGGTFSNGINYMADSISNQKDIGAYIGFTIKKGEKFIIRIGTSFTSINEARKNLKAEIPGWNFTALRLQTKQVWEKALKKIQVQGKENDKHIFYTAMYHTMQLPRLFNDADGTYPEFSQQYKLARLEKGKSYYDDYSMWDIYRAELPLYEIIDHKLINNLAASIILKGKQSGWIPIFPCWNSYTNEMIGDHSTAFIASAYLKGIKDYDINEGYRLMRQNAYDTPSDMDYQDGKGRRALDDYIKYGFIPLENPVKYAYHSNEQVSRTLEYAYDDYALAMIAKTLNKTKDYQQLISRSNNYKNVFDTTIGMVRGKHSDGSWISQFNADQKASYISEGTPRQLSFYVPQDVAGLTKLMGGKDKLESSLDSLFAKGEYWHGNEPGHQVPFMYDYTNAPWKTQKTVRKILEEEYLNGPGGLSGNDDAGQISAWYVFGAIGFYPVDPVSDRYQLCSPLFNRVTIQLPNGKMFTVVTHKKNDQSSLIKSMTLNGKAYTNNYILYDDLIRGGKLEIILTNFPTGKL